MNDDQMRLKIDLILARVDRKLKRRRLGPVAKTGVAVGLAAVVESCSKIFPPDEGQPLYGVEIDAAALDAADAAVEPDAVVLYGFMDASAPDTEAVELATLYGFDAEGFDQPIYPPYSIPDAGLDELSVIYGIPDAGVDDAGLGDLVTLYGVPDVGSVSDADQVDMAPIPPYGLPPDAGE